MSNGLAGNPGCIKEQDREHAQELRDAQKPQSAVDQRECDQETATLFRFE